MCLGVIVLAFHITMTFSLDKIHTHNHRLIRFVNHCSIRIIFVFDLKLKKRHHFEVDNYCIYIVSAE